MLRLAFCDERIVLLGPADVMRDKLIGWNYELAVSRNLIRHSFEFDVATSCLHVVIAVEVSEASSKMAQRFDLAKERHG